MYETLCQVKEAYVDNKYKPKISYPTGIKLKEGTVIDENQTVVWNREEVARLNAELDVAKNMYNIEQTSLSKRMHVDAALAIKIEYDFTKLETAQKIWDAAYADKHSYMNDVWGYAEELAGFIRDCMDLEYD